MENCRRCGKQLDKGVQMCIECGSKDITNLKNDLGAALVGVPVFGFLFFVWMPEFVHAIVFYNFVTVILAYLILAYLGWIAVRFRPKPTKK